LDNKNATSSFYGTQSPGGQVTGHAW